MKNLNELYLENEEKRVNKANYENGLLIERLARDIKNLTLNERFMKEAEETLIANGCFKICHSGVIVDDNIYTLVGKNYSNVADEIFSKQSNYQQLQAASEEVQELIGKEFFNFWADHGVSVIFCFGNIFFVVNSLWDKINNQCKKMIERNKGPHKAVFFPEEWLNKISKKLDIVKYVSGPFCYIE